MVKCYLTQVSLADICPASVSDNELWVITYLLQDTHCQRVCLWLIQELWNITHSFRDMKTDTVSDVLNEWMTQSMDRLVVTKFEVRSMETCFHLRLKIIITKLNELWLHISWLHLYFSQWSLTLSYNVTFLISHNYDKIRLYFSQLWVHISRDFISHNCDFISHNVNLFFVLVTFYLIMLLFYVFATL